jgi:hypothetical protein
MEKMVPAGRDTLSDNVTCFLNIVFYAFKADVAEMTVFWVLTAS